MAKSSRKLSPLSPQVRSQTAQSGLTSPLNRPVACRCQQRHDDLTDWGGQPMLVRFTKDHADADIPLQRLAGLPIAEHRGGHIRWCIAESAEELIDNVIAQIFALRRATTRHLWRYLCESAATSSRRNIPARRPVSTISPETAFANKLVPGRCPEVVGDRDLAAGVPEDGGDATCRGQCQCRSAAKPNQPSACVSAEHHTIAGNHGGRRTVRLDQFNLFHAVLQDAYRCGRVAQRGQPPAGVAGLCPLDRQQQEVDGFCDVVRIGADVAVFRAGAFHSDGGRRYQVRVRKTKCRRLAGPCLSCFGHDVARRAVESPSSSSGSSETLVGPYPSRYRQSYAA